MFDYTFLQTVWWILVIVLLSGFVIFDGFDLGALALNPIVAKTDAERRVVINTIAPHWDGNQVWLLTGGGAIFAAWPEVYATSFSGFYLAMILILGALYFRPVGLEYRSKAESESNRRLWDLGLFASGFVPSLVVGVALGNVLQGLPFQFDDLGRSFYGTGEFFLMNLLRLLNPFALLCGVVSLSVFTLQGATWILMRVEKDTAVYQRTKRIAVVFLVVFLATFTLAGVWLFFMEGYQLAQDTSIIAAAQEDAVTRGGSWYQNYFSFPLLFVFPVLTLVAYLYALKSVKADKNACAFVATSVGVLSAFITYAVSLFPFVFPSSLNPAQSLTIWNATSSQYTLNVMLWVAIIFVPIVLSYTAFAYYKMWTRLSPKLVEENTHALY